MSDPIPIDRGQRSRQPPNDTATEANLLGAALLTADAATIVAGIDPGDFYAPNHQNIAHAIRQLHDRGEPGDPGTVAAQLHHDNLLETIGGAGQLITIQANCPSTKSAATWALIVTDLAGRRRLLHATDDLREALYGGLPVHNHVTNVAQAAIAADSGDGLFHDWTMDELLDAERSFRWLVRGCWTDPTYGQIAGAMKTLKSHVATFMHLAIASGQPMFGRFEVEQPRPVVVYVGEGGRVSYTERLERIAAAMGVTLRDIPLYPRFDVAPIQSDTFRRTLARDLRNLNPGLICIDPLYAFHGTDTKSSDLHAEGSLLSSLSTPCIEVGASLTIVNHYNQTGEGTGLKRITMAGSGEWVDSWMLLTHRVPADVDNGKFRLSMELGSRRWGGSTWDLDLDVGRFDPELGRHIGDMAWALRRGNGASDTPQVVKDDAEKLHEMMIRISAALEKSGRALNTTDIRGIVHKANADVVAALGQLAHHECVALAEVGKSKWYSHIRRYEPPVPEETETYEQF